MNKIWPEIIAVILVSSLVAFLHLASRPITIGQKRSTPTLMPPPDFASIRDIKLRKQTFITYFAELAQRGNETILAERQQILSLFSSWQRQQRLSTGEQAKLCYFAEKYKLQCHVNEKTFRKLLRRVDIVPVSLLIAQAAIESGWGTSRFAQEANNYFGIWCYRPGCGLKPLKRKEGSQHFVRRYKHPMDSVYSYLYNLNVGHAYQWLRQIRAQLRAQQKPITGLSLTDGLSRYSARGRDYAAEIKMIITHNHLTRFDRLETPGNK